MSLLSYLNYICWAGPFDETLRLFLVLISSQKSLTFKALLPRWKADIYLFMNCVELTALNVFCTVGGGI